MGCSQCPKGKSAAAIAMKLVEGVKTKGEVRKANSGQNVGQVLSRAQAQKPAQNQVQSQQQFHKGITIRSTQGTVIFKKLRK